MPCSQTLASYKLSDCFSSRGGIKAVWAAPYVENGFTIGESGTVTGFSTGVTWLKQELHRNLASLTSTYNYDDTSRSSYVLTEATWQYLKMQKESRLQMNALAKGDLMVVVEDANGTYFALGQQEPVKVTAGTGSTGTDRGDRNAYEVTVSDYNEDYPPILDQSAIEKLSQN